MWTKIIIKILIGKIFQVAAFKFNLLKGKIIILMYHRVFDESNDGLYDSAMYVFTKTLEMHIREIKRHFDVIHIDEIDNGLKHTKPVCVLTFDDGWEDNYHNAYPLLKQYTMPATVFLATGLIGRKYCFWSHNIWELVNLVKERGLDARLVSAINEKIGFIIINDLSEENIFKLTEYLKKNTSDRNDLFLSELTEDLGIEQSNNKALLDWEEVMEMGQFNVTFGSHTVNHAILPVVTDSEKNNEIVESLEILKQKNVSLSKYFCYPNGDYDEITLKILKNNSYNGAVTTKLGVNTDRTDRFLLRRVELHDSISNRPSLFWFRIFQAYIV